MDWVAGVNTTNSFLACSKEPVLVSVNYRYRLVVSIRLIDVLVQAIKPSGTIGLDKKFPEAYYSHHTHHHPSLRRQNPPMDQSSPIWLAMPLECGKPISERMRLGSPV